MKQLVAFGIGLLLVSCAYHEAGHKSIPIDSKVIIEVREVLDPNSRRLTFFCKTERNYPCVNFPLLTVQHPGESSFDITFTAVGEASICLTAIGPATALLDLNELSSGGYDIAFNVADLRNKGKLIVTDTDIALLFASKSGIDFVRQITKRVPANTYWGTIGYHVESSETLVNEFIQKFADAGAAFDKQSPGHYFYYEIDDSGDMVSDVEHSGYYFMKSFIFQYAGDESKLKELVQVEGKNYKETLSLRLETYKGDTFYNW